jgi:hypothetical protein
MDGAPLMMSCNDDHHGTQMPLASAVHTITLAAQAGPYGRIAMIADPFRHGLCLIEFNGAGYDALV